MTKLKRGLGFWGAYSTSVGLVVSGTAMVALGNGFGTGGLAFVVPAFAGLVIITLVSFSYSELASMMPGGGMIGEYTLPALGRLLAMVAVLGGYLVLVATDGGTQMIIAGQSLETVTGIPGSYFSWAILVILVFVNMLGIDVFGRLQISLAVGLMLPLGLFGLLGGLGLGGQEMLDNPVMAADWSTLAQMGAVAIWLYIGMEFVCPLAEEIKKPWKNIPLGMGLGVLSIFVVDILFGWGATRFTALDELAASSTPQILAAEAMFGGVGQGVMVAVTVFAAFSTGNAELSAVPRMLYGLANDGMLPRIFAYVHPKRRAPWVGIIFTSFLMALTLTYSTFNDAGIELILTLISIACVTWLLSYIIAQINVLVLRRRYPEARRPFRTPFFPIPQILGIAACVYLIIFVSPDQETRVQIWSSAGIILAIIVAFSVCWLRAKKLPLFKPVPLSHVVNRITERSEPLDSELDTDEKTGENSELANNKI